MPYVRFFESLSQSFEQEKKTKFDYVVELNCFGVNSTWTLKLFTLRSCLLAPLVFYFLKVRRDLFELLDYVTFTEYFQIGDRKNKKKKKKIKEDMVKHIVINHHFLNLGNICKWLFFYVVVT